jgi:hypothetical protein
MVRIKKSWRTLMVIFLVVSGTIIMSSCNNQVCPAYSKSEKATTIKPV